MGLGTLTDSMNSPLTTVSVCRFYTAVIYIENTDS